MAIIPKKNEMPTQDPKVRAHNFKEVATGYTEEIALAEADRCLNCKNRPCVAACPVNISIPEFIAEIKNQRSRYRANQSCRHFAHTLNKQTKRVFRVVKENVKLQINKDCSD